jgi:hypothetical protein
MKNVIITGCFIVAALAVPAFVKADTASGTLTVTGTVASSITLSVESADGTFGGASVDATSDLGTISKYGTAPTGFTIARGATTWTLSAVNGVGVRVDKANSASADYTLNAQLATAPATGVLWKLNGSTLNATTGTELTASGVYATTGTYSWDIVIPDALANASAIDNVLQFSALAN